MGKIKSVIGFEVDSTEMRAIEITRSGGAFSILACGKSPLAEGIIEEGFIRDADAFTMALSELLQSGKFKATDVVVGVNNENVIMRYASFPQVPEDKLRNMVLLQAQEFIPIPVQEMEIDYVIAGEGVNDDEQPIVNVLLVAARRSMLEQLINIFSASKLQVNEIESSVLSMTRAAQKVAAGKNFALLNLTDDMLNFLVVKNNDISMVRSITIPERAADAVANLFKNADEDITEDEIDTVGAMLGAETSSSVSYYSMQSGIEPIENIYFMANTTKRQDLITRITDIVSNIPVTIPDVYEDMNFGLESSVIKDFAGCIGLAIQALEG
ncbi:MAG: pilus assembly protein PilM [Oscillospiraceae bacterium]